MISNKAFSFGNKKVTYMDRFSLPIVSKIGIMEGRVISLAQKCR